MERKYFIIVGAMLLLASMFFVEANYQENQSTESTSFQSIQRLEPKKPILYDDDGDGWVVVPNLDLKIKCLNLQKRIYEDC